MASTSDRRSLSKAVEGALEKYAGMQINLRSAAARRDLASVIVGEVCSKFYLVPYGSNKEF